MAWTPDPSWLPQHNDDPDKSDGSPFTTTVIDDDDEPLAPARPLLRRGGKTTTHTAVTDGHEAGDHEPRRGGIPRPLLVAGAGLAVLSVAVAIASGVKALPPGDAETPLPTAAEQSDDDSTTAASPPAFCPDRTDGDAVTTAGPGDMTTEAGVIAALDYAYYTERDARKIHSLMVQPPSSVAAIQAEIDAVPDGTQACVTTTPDDRPGVWLVDVRVQKLDRSESWLHQRITVTAAGEEYRIARIEDRNDD